ncbi:hypothetical protein OS493_023893 [Desmophyllum pertusum]|uniref:ParB/Sulfiredoxin domain-containing protein n=1 Tax=Desmophyllum pertusum TaxID=174260 RepID=A0A9X0CFF2_9CNID|nr:hypothetical protein OS493_023893 [Desmophyllum pertusum]
MLEMYCTNTNWCHYVVWTPVGYNIYLVKRDDEYIADLLSYLKQFWDSANDREGTMPHWQADALDLKKRAEEISRNCQKLSSGNSVRDDGILEHKFIDLFWNCQDETKHYTKPTPRKCGGCKVEEWKCKLNPCEIRLERLKRKNVLVTKPLIYYQSYSWGSGGSGGHRNSYHQDTILEFLYHPFRRQIKVTPNSGKGMCVLEQCFKLREDGNFLESKLKLWKWLRDETDNGQIYYAIGRSASIIGIFFRLMENSNQSSTLNFRITERTATVCTLEPQKHTRKRTKHHVIFPLTDDDVLREYASTDHKYKMNLVIEHLLTRTNQLTTSGRCGNVICDRDSPDQSPSISEITTVTKTVQFCHGVNRVTSEDLVNRVAGPSETAHSSPEDEPEQCQLNTMKDPNHFFKYLDEPLPKEILDCKSNNYLAKSFVSELPYQMVDTNELWEFREFDRFLTPKVKDEGARLEQIRRYVIKFGIDSPLILTYNTRNGKVYLAEGNHRLAVAMREGIP